MNIKYYILEEALISCDQPSALLVTSVDDLYGIGRTHGLRTMEAARYEFHSRLIRIKRPIDSLFMLTDDLACLLIRNLEHSDHALLAANRFESIFKPSFVFDEEELTLKPTAGMVYFEQCQDATEADRIFRQAEQVRSNAYQERKYCEFKLYSQDTQEPDDTTLVAHFDRALEKAEFSLDYQPQYRLHDGELVGAEALIRWRTDERVIPPDLFLPSLTHEQHWALFQYAFRLAARNRDLLPFASKTALNLDPVVLNNPNLVEFIEKDSTIWGLDPAYISFEVTESATVDNFETAVHTLNNINAMGFSTSIDDFGSQHASFEHLRNLPADEVKIDRQFVAHIKDRSDDQEMVKSIIDMCHRFGKKVVAEGIEDGHTVEHLIDFECDIGQGFYLGMPMSITQFSELLRGLAPLENVSAS